MGLDIVSNPIFIIWLKIKKLTVRDMTKTKVKNGQNRAMSKRI